MRSLRTDPPVPTEKARLEELLTAQQSTWEEKEKLSQQLEDERQNNVNAAIGQVIIFIQHSTVRNAFLLLILVH